MSLYSYLVIGAGGVGPAISHLLLKYPDTARVTLADRDGAVADRAAVHHASDMLVLDTRERSGRALRSILEPYDVVISAIPARFSPKLVRCSIDTNTPFCDLGGVVSTTLRIRELADEARRARTCIVTDDGVMPGHGNIIVDSLLERVDVGSGVSVVVRAGGIPRYPKGPLNHARTFSPEGLWHVCMDDVPVLINGEITYVAPFSGIRHVVIPELLELNPQFTYVESFVTAGAGLAPWSLRDRGVRNFQEQTLRWPGFIRGFMEYSDADDLSRDLEPVNGTCPDILYMDVTVTEDGGTGRSERYRLMDHYDPSTGLSAMARTTGFPTAVVAHMLAMDTLPPGVWTPEEVLRTTGMTERYLNQVELAL